MNHKNCWLLALLLSIILLMAGCVSTPPTQPTAMDQTLSSLNNAITGNRKVSNRQRIPASVSAALVPSMSVNLPQPRQSSARRFNISVHDVPAQQFFMSLVQGTNYNMVVSPKVTGNVSLDLKHVTIDQALKIAQDVYGYDYQKTSYGYEVYPNKLLSRMFTVNYLDADRSGKSITTLSTGQISQKIQGTTGGSSRTGSLSRTTTQEQKRSGGEVDTTTKLDFWTELAKTLQTMVGDKAGQSVVVNPQAGLVIVKAFPNQLQEVGRYLDAIQSNMDRQVILEAKILEVNLNNHYQAGIDWQIFGANLNSLFPTDEPFPGTNNDNSEGQFPPAYTINISSGPNFNAFIKALGTQGNIQVLSNPRVSTLNNQKAVIKVGSDEFFVTGIATSTTETVAGSTTPTQDVELTPFFSGITLDVTPQIGPNGWITLHIHPSISKVVDQQKQIEVADQQSDLPLAFSTIRETDTVVRARNGQVIVLGGLMENQTREDVSQIPFFGNIPFLGTLFRNTKQVSQKSELVILLRAIVIGKCSWNTELRQAHHTFNNLNPGFHFGDRPDLFGTMGEQHIYHDYYSHFHQQGNNHQAHQQHQQQQQKSLKQTG